MQLYIYLENWGDFFLKKFFFGGGGVWGEGEGQIHADSATENGQEDYSFSMSKTYMYP